MLFDSAVLLQTEASDNGNCSVGQAIFSPSNSSALFGEQTRAVVGGASGACEIGQGVGCSLMLPADVAGKVCEEFAVLGHLIKHALWRGTVEP